jgi:SSS family solute:Na+ symporter
VLSFGYWCTDFLVVQRAMAANSMNAARRTPLIAAVPKMLFPVLVILPGMIAVAVAPRSDIGYAGSGAYGGLTPVPIEGVRPQLVAQGAPLGVRPQLVAQAVPLGVRPQGLIPPKVDEAGQPVVGTDGRVALDYDLAIPMMLKHYFPAGMLGLGLCALMASFMSGMAGNTTAFNTVWTYDIYQSYIKPNASDAHYLAMGRAATIFGIAISVGAAFVARQFNNIMDLLQLVFAFVNAPLFATFMLGMFWKRATGHGAFIGLLSGTLAAAVHHGLTLPAGAVVGFKGGFLGAVVHTYPSEMAQNFWTAIFAWTTCLLVTIFVSLFTEPRRDEELTGLVYSLTPVPHDRGLPWHKRPGPLAIGVGAATIVLNLIFW